MDFWHEFQGPNAAYILDLYERFRRDPGSVDDATRRFFTTWSPPSSDAAPLAELAAPGLPIDKIVCTVNLAQAIRNYGYLAAQLDPLGNPPPGEPWLDLAYYGLVEEDLRSMPATVVGGEASQGAANALEAVERLRTIYSGTIGYSYGHVREPKERDWLRQAAESGRFRSPSVPFDPLALLDRLTEVEAFEQFLHRIFPGKTRFSIEGLDMLVPMLDSLLGLAMQGETCLMLISMAHRGRLNVLAHVLGKPYAQVLAEFTDPGTNMTTRNELGWTGDVRYHTGGLRAVAEQQQVQIVLEMPPNPSHLEHIDPVLVGMARAAGSRTDQPGPPQFFSNAALPVMIHGDAAFPAQGIVAETLNLSRLPGYTVGGTLHIIANNQLGYTTLPVSGRSTLHASDLAKGYSIPIIHANADDPLACLEATRTAFAYRQDFGKDFLVNLVGYRRYGHNEGDEPAFTQPLMYKMIADHPSVCRLWAERLEGQGLVKAGQADDLVQARMDHLQSILERLEPERELPQPELKSPPPGEARRVKTNIPLERLRALHQSLLRVPETFHLNRKLERTMSRRRKILDNPYDASVDWSTAEELALASILADGVPIRFSGEDTQRGTFSQRHAVFHDIETGETYTPLQALPQACAAFEILNSPLSETGALGFEFGYSIQEPGRLVIWEAQYGDFINVSQVILDEFLLSARAKWEQTPSLVVLLPHGNEGQGPNHSSARPERFLQLAAQTNLRLANCTTAAQYFHLLRRQAALLSTDPLPLIILTPKSLLRHPLVASPAVQLSEGSFCPILINQADGSEGIRRLLLCSGKIAIDLISKEAWKGQRSTAIGRLEQLYPYPEKEIGELLASYPNLEEVVWIQEEPRNMGAWPFYQPVLEQLLGGRWPLNYIGRGESSSPAEGSGHDYIVNQEAILKQALPDPFSQIPSPVSQPGDKGKV